MTVVSGPPGSGKTILAQQICFHNGVRRSGASSISARSRSRPRRRCGTCKQFAFFDPKQARARHPVRRPRRDPARQGARARARRSSWSTSRRSSRRSSSSTASRSSTISRRSTEELRKFGYELAVNLMAWEATALLLGEYAATDYTTNPLFSIVDGLVVLVAARVVGRAAAASPDHQDARHRPQPRRAPVRHHAQRRRGLRAARHDPRGSRGAGEPQARCKTGIAKLDELLGDGIPRGSSLLVAGVAGTGKTVLSLEFIYRGALAGEKGILFSFEETDERLRAHGARARLGSRARDRPRDGRDRLHSPARHPGRARTCS